MHLSSNHALLELIEVVVGFGSTSTVYDLTDFVKFDIIVGLSYIILVYIKAHHFIS